MGTLIKYEFKKLYMSRLNKIVFFGTCLFMLVFMIGSVLSAELTDKEGKTVLGMDAVRYWKESRKELEGPLTDERVGEIIQEYQSIVGNPDNFGEEDLKDNVKYGYYLPRRELLYMIRGSYYGFDVGESYELLLDLPLEQRKDFYEARAEQIHKILVEGRHDWKCIEYTKAEQKFWKKKAEKMVTPIYYGDAGGWIWIIDSLGYFLFAVMGLCIMLARTYAGEYESGAEHIILTTKYGKTKIIAAKNLAVLLFGGLYSLINIGIPYVVNLSVFGIRGGGFPVQNYSGSIVYPLTCIQAALLYSGLCMAVGFGMSALVLFLSARVKNGLPVLAVSMGIILSGFFLNHSATNSTYNHIIALLPFHAIQMFPLYDMLSYPFGNFVLDYPSVIFVVYLTLGAVLIFFAGKAFRRHEVE